MDERLGRSCANALKLRFTGVLGILLSAKPEGRISRIAPLIGQLDQLGFRLSSKARAAILKQAGE
jgi:predicted nucleic acid-binding protein